MKRLFSILGWTALAFIGSVVVIAATSAAFGLLVVMYDNESDTVLRFITLRNWLILIGSLALAAIVLLFGVKGRLPGTRRSTPPALPSRSI